MQKPSITELELYENGEQVEEDILNRPLRKLFNYTKELQYNDTVTNNLIANNTIELQKLQDITKNTVIGRGGSNGVPQQLDRIDFLQAMDIKDAVDYNVGETEQNTATTTQKDVMGVGQFNIGVSRDENLKVLTHQTSLQHTSWTSDGGFVEPDYQHTYGDIKTLKSGFYVLGEQHQQNPLNGMSFQTLIVTAGISGNVQYLLFSDTTPTRVFTQNKKSFDDVNDWDEMIKLSDVQSNQGDIKALTGDESEFFMPVSQGVIKDLIERIEILEGL